MPIIRNLFAVLSAELVGKIVGFITTIYLARVLQPEGFGILNFAAVSANYLILLVNFGFNDYGVLKVSPDRSMQNIERQLSNLFGLRLAIAIASFGALFVVSFLIPKFHQIQSLLLIFGLSVFGYALSTDWLFTAIERMEFIAIGRIAGSLFYIGMIFLFVKSSKDLVNCGLITAGRQFLVVFLMIFFFVWRVGSIRFNINGHEWRRILRFVLPIGLSSIATAMYFNVDVVIIGFLKSPEEVGYYAAALKLVMLGVSLKLLVGSVIYPKIVRYSASSKETLRKASLLIEKYSIIGGMLIGFIGSILGKDIIELIYGVQFAASVMPFQIAVWVTAIGFMGIVFPYVLLSVDRKLFAKVICLTVVINVLMNFILIPFFGILGAAFSYVGSTLYHQGLCYYFAQRKGVPISIKPLFCKPIVSSIMSTIGMLMVFQKLHFLLVLSFGLLLYFGTLAVQGISLRTFQADMRSVIGGNTC